MRESELENIIASRTPRGAPAELRERVLSDIGENLPNRPRAPSDLRAPRLWQFDRCLNTTLAISVLLAVVAWSVSLRQQSVRLAALLGPNESVRQAERIVDGLGLEHDGRAKNSLRDQLVVALERRKQRRGHRRSIHSLDNVFWRRSLVINGGGDEVETQSQDRAGHDRDSSYYRSGRQLDFLCQIGSENC
jgi:hypothetical protein